MMSGIASGTPPGGASGAVHAHAARRLAHSSSTSATPTYALVTIGGTASATIARNAGVDCTVVEQASGARRYRPSCTARTRARTRERAADVGDVDRDRRLFRRWPSDQADRQRDERGEQDRHDRELQVLAGRG